VQGGDVGVRGRGRGSFVLMTENTGAAGSFRQVMLCEYAPFAGAGGEPERNDCPECHGERAVRYPVCQPASG